MRLAPLMAALLAPALPAVAACDAVLDTDSLCVAGVQLEDVAPSDIMVRIQPPHAQFMLAGELITIQLLGADGAPVRLADARWGVALFAADQPGLGGDIQLLPSQNLHRALWAEVGRGVDETGAARVELPLLGTHVVLVYAYMEAGDGSLSRSAFYDTASEALAASGRPLPQLSYAATPLVLL